MLPPAQGWYHDPYGIHQDRYFSCGWPTKLVRDGAIETYDLPPDAPLPHGDLIPAAPRASTAPAGLDLRRADQALEPADRIRRAIFDYFDQLPKP
jgi:hypothetical protein